MSIDELIAVCEAAKSGKTIQEEFGGWRKVSLSKIIATLRLRVAPEPREIWVNEMETGVGGFCYLSKEAAERNMVFKRKIIRFREVLEDEK